jgi:hypothetical protein
VLTLTALALLTLPSAELPRIIDVQAEGAVRPLAEELLGQPATPDRLTAFVRRAEALPEVGELDLRLEPQGSPQRVVLVVVNTPGASHIARVGWQIDAQVLEDDAAWRLSRRIDADAGLTTAPGRRQHPWLLGLDRRAIQQWYQERGHREVAVDVQVEPSPGLVRLVWRVRTGPRALVAAVGVEGVPPGLRTAALQALSVQVGAPTAASRLAADEATLTEVLCRAGHPRARVLAQEIMGVQEGDVRPVTVKFVADPGPYVVTGPVQVAGRFVPRMVIELLPLREGQPYCPALRDAAQRRIREFLRDTGVPDPRITVEARTWITPAGQRVEAVTFDVRQLADARVERIWFVGNTVTRPDILRQLLAIEEGDLYRQTAVDESVQAMRRSGLFQRVDVDLVEGATPERVSLRFQVQERKVFTVDVVARSLTLFNMDLTALPTDLRDVEHGHALRGGGQRVDLLAQSTAFGFRWRDDFLSRWWVTRASVVYSSATNDAYEEAWLNADLGLGIKGGQGSRVGTLFMQGEWTRTDRVPATGVPVLDGDTFTGAVGFDGRLDLTRRDDERIQFLGLEASTVVRLGTSLAGEALTWIDDTTRLRLHLPLWKTTRQQHWVLRLTARNRGAFAADDGDLQGHQRLFASARGYKSSSIGVPFALPPLAPGLPPPEVVLGGLHAIDGSIELRIPLPFGHRNALAPFFDAAATADEVPDLFRWSDARTSVGLLVTFSLFDERIEGAAWAAWPFDEDAEAEYVGGSFGGSF